MIFLLPRQLICANRSPGSWHSTETGVICWSVNSTPQGPLLVTTPLPDPVPPPALTREAAAALTAELAAEMVRRWRQGDRVLPEDFLARHPALRQHPEAVADLIYEELCLRQELGPEVPSEEVLRRFPDWRPQLEVLIDCQRLLGPGLPAPRFPVAGEFLGDFLLLAELGARGPGPSLPGPPALCLGDRPVVLSSRPPAPPSMCRWRGCSILTSCPFTRPGPSSPRAARLHALVRRRSLAQLLEALRSRAPARRMGRDLLDALDRLQTSVPAEAPAAASPAPVAAGQGASSAHPTPRGGEGRGEEEPVRNALAGATYEQALCSVGACLADALGYAHDRGLLHLDLKPSNVLLAADGQPMLLDFHLAQGTDPSRPARAAVSGRDRRVHVARTAIRPGGHQPGPAGGAASGCPLRHLFAGRRAVRGPGGGPARSLGKAAAPLPPQPAGERRTGRRDRQVPGQRPQWPIPGHGRPRRRPASPPGRPAARWGPQPQPGRAGGSGGGAGRTGSSSRGCCWRSSSRRARSPSRPPPTSPAGSTRFRRPATRARCRWPGANGRGQSPPSSTAWPRPADCPFTGTWPPSSSAGCPVRRMHGPAQARAAARRELHRLADRLRFLYAAEPLPAHDLRGLKRTARAVWGRAWPAR